MSTYTDEVERCYIYGLCREKLFAPGELHKIENFEKAYADYFHGWCIHHRNEIPKDGSSPKSRASLIAEGLYYNRPAVELIFLRRSEHTRLHATLEPVNTPKDSDTESSESSADYAYTRYAVICRHIRKGESVCSADYHFYRRYCLRHKLPKLKASVDNKLPMLYGSGNMQDSRYVSIMAQLNKGCCISSGEFRYLKRYCSRTGADMPPIASELRFWLKKDCEPR